jgi:hypothetical protein
MPKAWLQVLLNEKVVDKADTLYKLKYVYSIDDVYDILEFLEVQDTITRNMSIQEESKNANR